LVIHYFSKINQIPKSPQYNSILYTLILLKTVFTAKN